MRINEKTIVIRNLEIDEKDFKGFVKYLNDFYGKKGVYPNKFGKDLQPRDILKAIDKVAKAKPKHEWDWDSLDRELVRDELIDMGVFDYPTQESAIKEISEVGALYEEKINEADVVGKTIFSDGKGKLFFGYYKTDDGVTFVDYKTWKGLSFKDVSKGDTNKERVIKAILKGQKQFNKKVEFNMWTKQKKRTFEETMDWFIQNGWINNINKGGIKESVDVLSVNEIQYKDAVAKFNDELIKHPMVKKAAQHYKKTPAEIVKVLQQRLSTKGNRGGDTKEVSIDFKDTNSGITIKHKMKFNESVNEAVKPSQVSSTISKVKKELMRKWKQKGGYENFGQKELSQLKDKFDYNPYGSPDERQIAKMLDGFNNWAMNYDGNMREGKKRFKQQDGIGSSKYTISYHDGKKKNKDGSDFFDIKIFKNKPDLEAFKKDLVSKGFVKESNKS